MKLIFVCSAIYIFTPAFLHKIWASTRDIVAKLMLKKTRHVYIIFDLHRKIGYHGIWAPGKAGWLLSCPLRIDSIQELIKAVSEGKLLSNSIWPYQAFVQPNHRRQTFIFYSKCFTAYSYLCLNSITSASGPWK